MTADQRTAYWTFTIAKARELWGDGWGLAINSVERRTQCHAHIHIGKLREASRTIPFSVVDGPAEIPLPLEGDGLLVHPAGDKLHVHTGNDAPELQLATIRTHALEIAKLPTAENSVDPPSSRPTTSPSPASPSAPERTAHRRHRPLRPATPIPAGHKVALRAIAAGEMVLRYGQAIGRAKHPDRRRAAHPHPQPLVRGADTSTTSSRPREVAPAAAAQARARPSWVPARRRPRRHAELHRGRRRQQLRRPHRRDHRPQL